MDSFFVFLELSLPWTLLILGASFWLQHNQYQRQQQIQALDLALKMKEIAQGLSTLPSEESVTLSQDLFAVLQFVHLILEELSEKNNVDSILVTEVPDKPQNSSELPIPPEPLVKPSTTAKDLIKLRDWILLARIDAEIIKPEILESIYQRLGQTLQKEGMVSLEETGLFNLEQQEIVGTQSTDDPSLDDVVCETIRPGYLFHGKLFRSQEVVIYTT